MIQKLIDAYELEREMYRKCIDTDEEIEKGRAKWDSGLWIRYKVFEDTIILAPRVDPVKHGHWTSSQGLAEVGEVQCSNCKTIYYGGDLYLVGETDENGIGQALMPNYCPHCGAKMDEVEDETE